MVHLFIALLWFKAVWSCLKRRFTRSNWSPNHNHQAKQHDRCLSLTSDYPEIAKFLLHFVWLSGSAFLLSRRDFLRDLLEWSSSLYNVISSNCVYNCHAMISRVSRIQRARFHAGDNTQPDDTTELVIDLQISYIPFKLYNNDALRHVY